jgi:hypothetical protein
VLKLNCLKIFTAWSAAYGLNDIVPVEISAGQTSSLHTMLGVNRLGTEFASSILNLISFIVIGCGN